MSRIDLSNWIIHFVHDRKPVNDPRCFCVDPDTGDNYDFPDCFDDKGEPQYILNTYADEDFSIEEDAPAFSVLKKILHDGYIKSGWSFRSSKPTIYGPCSAVCFTEMPLYALIQYARGRGSYSGYVGNYGIALKKQELFEAGARPVIYGLSSDHIEAEENDPFFENGGSALRLLSTVKTGIGVNEQYRYVYTRITKEKPIDWTHEREWRWPLKDDRYGVPGLPILLSDEYANFFKEIFVIVSTDIEKSDVLKRLKNMYDSGGTNTGFGYNIALIKDVSVISIESLATIKGDLSKIRIEDIPVSNISQIEEIVVRPEILEIVKKTWEEACKIAVDASDEYLEKELHGKDIGACGFSNVCTYEISEITQAFIDLKIAHTYSNDIYILYGLTKSRTQNVDVHERGAIAAAKYLTEKLGQHFSYNSELD